MVIFANPAGAHTADLTGSPECQTDGTYTITYTGHTKNSTLKSNVTVTDSQPAGTTITPNGLQNVPGNSTFHLSQSGVPGKATKALLSVHVEWTDGVKDDATARVNLPGTCAPPPNATATAPTFTDSTCASPTSSYTIPDVKGVDYQVEGKLVEAGTHDVKPGDSIDVKAVAEKGYTLTGKTEWPHNFPAMPTVCTGTAPHFTDASCTSPHASYTIPVTDGIQYWVDGHQATPGTHDAANGSTVKITAIAADGHALTGTTSWTHSFPDVPATCAIASHTTTPSFADSTCTSSGTYTIPSSATATYTVNGAPATAGTHTATPGTTVTVTASAKPGHTLAGTTTWTHTYPQAPTCGTPASLANTGPDAPVGKTILIAGLLALVGTLCLLAGRRPTAARHRVSNV